MAARGDAGTIGPYTMGYFKRKRNRGRIRTEVRQAEATWDPDAAEVWDTLPQTPPTRRCFLRFATVLRDDYSSRREGIFTAAARILDDPDLDAPTEQRVSEFLDWFNEHLPVPQEFDRRGAVFFFKSTAKECVRQIWNLVQALESAGVRCEMQRFDDPGLVVLEDEYQVAVVPRSGPSTL